ncbi:MAG TPA: AMP-binding protein [Nitrospira sp.]|jgi:acyl-coenzyme A synthetase/AMP-(fatty) acid ligase
MLFIEMISYWARAAPQRAAIVQHDMTLTYRTFSEAIDLIGDRIERLGLDKSEPVAVSICVPAFMLAAAFALMRAGYSIALANPPLFPYLRAAGVRNIIHDLAEHAPTDGRSIRFDRSWLASEASQTVWRQYEKRPTRDVDMIFFSSGSTGQPKRVAQTGSALDQLLGYYYSIAGSYQTVLNMPGLATSFGFNRACEVLNLGRTICLAPDVDAGLSLVDKCGVELIVASTQQVLVMVEAKRRNPAYRLGTVKEVVIGGSRIGPDGLAAVRTELSPNVSNWYGTTEAGLLASAPFEAIEATPTATGFVMPWNELEIVDQSRAVLDTDTEGLVRCRTPKLIESLRANGPDEVLGMRDGWYYPGDMGRITADGILSLSRRTADVINRGGGKLSVSKIEEALTNVPGIKEAAACPVEGRRGLDELWIAVVAEGAVNFDAIKQALRQHADVMIPPEEIFVLDELPRGELGKVQKDRLKELMLERKKRLSESGAFDQLFWTAKVQA